VAEIHFPVGTLGLGDGFNWWAIAGHSAIRGIVVSQFLEIIRYDGEDEMRPRASKAPG
jgi:hypothetical protein